MARRALGFVMLAAGLALITFIAVMMTRGSDDEAKAKAKADREQLLRDTQANIDRVRATDPPRASIAGVTFHQTRAEAIDGQCRGRGAPPFGFVIDGGTYAQNEIVGAQSRCAPFVSGVEDVTNLYCCPTRDLPAIVNPGHEP